MFSVTVMFCYVFHIKPHILFKILFQKQSFLFNFDVRGCAGGRIGTRFLRPRGISPLKGVTRREPRGIEMGPRASSA